MPKTIIENGIRVYKDIICKCGCGQRIPWRKSHKQNGIPDFIHGHQNIGTHCFHSKENEEKHDIFLLKPTIIIKGIKYYKNHICQCNGDCGERIRYPTTISGLKNHIRKGVPSCVHGHQHIGRHHTKISKEKIRKSRKKYNRTHPEKVLKGKNHPMYGKHPTKKTIQKLRKAQSGENNGFYGKHHTKESIKKNRDAHVGKIPWNKNKTNIYSKETIEKMCVSRPSMCGENNPNWVDGYCYQRKFAKRRAYGFEPLNKWFKGSEAHHVDKDLVIFIPKEMHASIWHRQNDSESMKIINNLAFEFYSIQWFEEHNIKCR